MKLNILPLISLIFLSGCISSSGFVTGLDGKLVRITDKEINQQRCILSQAKKSSDLKDQMKDVAIFSGMIIKRQVVSSSVIKVEVKVNWVLQGVQGDKVSVETAENSPYGIDFKVGEYYRIAAYKDNGTLETWSWMGTYKIDGNSLGLTTNSRQAPCQPGSITAP